MADINQASQELAEVLQRVTEEMRQFGRVSEETEAALRAGSFKRARDLDAAGKLTANALSDVAGAGLAAAKSLYAGQQGATQFNSALDGMAKAATAAGAALTFMMPGGFLVKALVGLGTAATVTAVEMTKAANEMANKLFDANVKMARSGAAASDGLTGLFNDAKKLGLSMNQLGLYADVVSGNAAELALFRGSVFEGRKAFANIGKSMQPFREQLEAAGIQLEDQIQGTAGYLRLQTQIGMSQNMTTQQLAMGARQYLIEMDGLAKLTGQQRQDIEKQMEAARNEQRFRAKLDAMRASGDAKQIAAADRLERANILIAKQSPELAQAFRDSASGVLSSDVAVKGMIGTNGELLRVTQQLTEGQMNEYQAFQNLGRAAGQFAKDMNFTAQLGLLNDFSIDYAQSMRIGIAAQRDVAVLAREIETEQRRQLGKENDVLAQELARMREATRQNNERNEKQIFDQIQSSLALGNRMNDVMTPLLDAFEKLTPLINRLRDSLTKLLDFLVPKLNAAVDKLNRLFPAEPGSTTLPERVANEGMFSSVGGGLGGYLGLKKGLASGAALGMRAPVYHPAAKLGTTVLGGIAGAAVGAFTGMTLGEFLDSYLRSNKPEPGGSTDAVDYGLVDPNLPTRAAGGPVTGKQPYLVGERGPELYVPEQSGNIVNNDKLSQILKDLTSSAFQNRQKFNQIGKTLGTDFQIVSTNSRKVAVDSKELMTDYSAVVQAVEEFKNLNQQNAQLTRDFADQYRIYIERCSDILRYSLQQMEAEGPPGAAAATAGSAVGGQGLVPGTGFDTGAVSAAPAPGQGLQIRNQDDLARLGLRIKRGDVQSEGAKISPKLLELAQQIQRTIPEFNVFTGFNDLFHQERHPRSAHTRGLAMDFTLAKPPTKEAGQDIVDYLKSLGFSYVADEYNRPNQFTTGGHFHAQLPEFADGGITQGPTIAGEKGPEAVVPLPDGRVIPVRITDNNMPDLSNRLSQDLQNLMKILPKEMSQSLGKVIGRDPGTVIPTAGMTQQLISVMQSLPRETAFALVSNLDRLIKDTQQSAPGSQTMNELMLQVSQDFKSSQQKTIESLDVAWFETSQDVAQLVSGIVTAGKNQDRELVSQFLTNPMADMPAAMTDMSAGLDRLRKDIGQATRDTQNTDLNQIVAEINKIKQPNNFTEQSVLMSQDLQKIAQDIADHAKIINSQTAAIFYATKTASKEISQQLAIDMTSAQLPAVKVLDNLLPDIGQTVNEQLKEVTSSVPTAQALGDMMQEIKTSFADSLSNLVESLQRKSDSANQQLVPLLENLVRTGRDQVDVSTKILQSNY